MKFPFLPKKKKKKVIKYVQYVQYFSNVYPSKKKKPDRLCKPKSSKIAPKSRSPELLILDNKQLNSQRIITLIKKKKKKSNTQSFDLEKKK